MSDIEDNYINIDYPDMNSDLYDWDSKYLEKVIDIFYELKKYSDENMMTVMLEKTDCVNFVEFVKTLKIK